MLRPNQNFIQDSTRATTILLQNLLNDSPVTKNALREPRFADSNKAKPFIQWIGGKRELIPQYEKFIPKAFNKYFEPFLGGGAMFFYIKSDTSILGDSNLELIKTYEGVRDNPEQVIGLLKKLKAKHSKDLYLAVRGLDRGIDIFSKLSNAEIAARMIYLNQTCFNGVYRVNKLGQFNVPIGSSLNRLICDEDTLRVVSRVLKGANIKCSDFEELVSTATNDDFIYLDPPYYPVSVYSDFTRYTKEKFYQEDQIRLKSTIDSLSDKGVKVMLSNSDCQFINNLYSDYNRHLVYSSRALNCKKDRRGKITELLITNY